MMRMPITRLLITAIVGVTMAACTNNPNRWHSPVKEQIDHTLEDAGHQGGAAAELTVPDDISQALLPPLQFKASAAATPPRELRFDLAADHTPARVVFMNLVKGTPYSMVVHPNVTGKITLQLKDVTIDEALDAIRQVYGYEYRREGNRFFILGQGIQTRIFRVNYLNLTRKGRSDTKVSSGELSDAGTSTSGTGKTTTSSRAHGIEVETKSEADFWKDLKTALEGIIGTEDGRRIVVNPQAGIVIVRAFPTELDLVQDFLGVTQSAVNRQVVLEAKIVEVDLRDSFQSGINWTGLGNLGKYDYLAAQTGGGTLLGAEGPSGLAGSLANLQPNSASSPVALGSNTSFGGIFSLIIKSQDFATFIELLQRQGDVHVLSSPRVSTVNNQKAVIKVGGDEFFVTGISNSQTTTGSTTTLAPEVELTPFFSGIALDVTPQINDADGIILHIHPTVSNVSQSDKSFIIGGENFSLPLAFSTIQESDNVVRAESGQIIIIGGLMKEATTDENASVPLLGDLPLIGNLFKHKYVGRIKRELVILLKPTIVDSANVWSNLIGESADRTRTLERPLQ